MMNTPSAISKSGRWDALETEVAAHHAAAAEKQASRGKRGHPGVAMFEHRLEDNLATLRSELREHTCRVPRSCVAACSRFCVAV